MEVKRVNNRILLILEPKEFMALQDVLRPTERISLQPILEEGLMNLYLSDQFVPSVVAILKEAPHEAA